MSERQELPDEVRTFVVQALACFDTPTEVARAVKDEFGLVVSRQAVHAYDPTKRAGADLSVGLRSIFEATRATFLASTAEIAVSHRSVRLRRLQRLADRAESLGNIALAADLLQQVAKEVGDAFTNRVALNHSGAVRVDAGPDFSNLDDDELAVMRLLLEKGAGTPDGAADDA